MKRPPPHPTLSPRGERGGAVLVFFLASALFFSPLLLTGRVLLPLDPATVAPWSELRRDASGPSNPLALDGLVLTLPARLYNHSMLRSGRIPFWNPHVFCGYPHFALIQNNVLYPLSLPFDLADPAAGIGYSLCLHLGLAGSLMFFFLRRTGLGTVGRRGWPRLRVQRDVPPAPERAELCHSGTLPLC